MEEGPIDFQTTAWSQVIRLREESGSVYEEAFDSLVQTYWRPVYAFIRRKGNDVHAAEDLTQAFFLLLIERDAFRHLEREKGSFRGYLCMAVRHFLVSQHRFRTAARRAPGRRVLGLENLEEKMGPLSARDDVTPELEYQRQWAREVIRGAVDRMEADYVKRDKKLAFDVFYRYVLGDQDRESEGSGPSHEELAEELGLTPTAVNNHVHRGKTAFQRFLRLTIADYVSNPEELEQELAELRSYF